MRWRSTSPSRPVAIIKPVDPDDPAVGDVIADWKRTPGAVAIRIMMTKEAKREPNHPGLDRIARTAAKHDLPVNMLCWGNLDAGMAVIDRHPDTRFIIDHLGILQPRTPPAPPQPWVDLPKVLDLAKRKNALIKVSGACTLSQQPYPFPGHLGSACPRVRCLGFRLLSVGHGLDARIRCRQRRAGRGALSQTDRLSDSERAMLMGSACAKAYRWSPKKLRVSRTAAQGAGIQHRSPAA